jgi:hypothetical protein
MRKSSEDDLSVTQKNAGCLSARAILYRCGADHSRWPLDADPDLLGGPMVIWETRSVSAIDPSSPWVFWGVDGLRFEFGRNEGWIDGGWNEWSSTYRFQTYSTDLFLFRSDFWSKCLSNGGRDPNRGPKMKVNRKSLDPNQGRRLQYSRRRLGHRMGP